MLALLSAGLGHSHLGHLVIDARWTLTGLFVFLAGVNLKRLVRVILWRLRRGGFWWV